LLLYFFFFQAEDGIRSLYVTGVQTCALPIFAASVTATPSPKRRRCLSPPTTRSSSPAASRGRRTASRCSSSSPRHCRPRSLIARARQGGVEGERVGHGVRRIGRESRGARV